MESQIHNLLVMGWCSNYLSHTGQGPIISFNTFWFSDTSGYSRITLLLDLGITFFIKVYFIFKDLFTYF